MAWIEQQSTFILALVLGGCLVGALAARMVFWLSRASSLSLTSNEVPRKIDSDDEDEIDDRFKRSLTHVKVSTFQFCEKDRGRERSGRLRTLLPGLTVLRHSFLINPPPLHVTRPLCLSLYFQIPCHCRDSSILSAIRRE